MAQVMGDLDRGRLPRHDQQAARRRVTAEVHQDVDGIGTDLGCDRFIAHADGRAPLGRHGLERRRHGVGLGHLGVAVEIDLAAVVVGQQRLEEMAGGMLAEIGRQVADTQLAIRSRIVGVRDRLRQQRLGVRLIEAAILGEDLGRRLMRMIVHAEQQVRMRQRIPGPQRQSAAEQNLGFVKAAKVLGDDGEVADPACFLRRQLHGAACGALRIDELAGTQMHGAKIAPAHGQVWIERDRLLHQRQRCGAFLLRQLAHGEIADQVSLVGTQRERALERGAGFVELPLPLQGRA